MKRLLALILLAFIVFSIAACNVNNDESSEVQSVNESSTDAEQGYQDGRYVSANDPDKYRGKTFSVLVKGNPSDTYQSDDFLPEARDLYGTLISDAVGNRNDYVEEKYGIILDVNKDSNIGNTLSAVMSSKDNTYHLIMPSIPDLEAYARTNMLVDLYTLESMNLEMPWYDQNANASFSMKNKLFFTLGDITIQNKVCAPSVTFNKEMVSEYGLDDPYDLVRKGKWTFDKMVEMSRGVQTINDPSDLTSNSNTYGMISSKDCGGFYGSIGGMLCEKNENDEPYLVLDSSTNISRANDVLTAYAEGDAWLVYAENFPADKWVTSLAAFSNGNALFRGSVFSAITKLRKATDCIDFGILPTPKWNEAQENYVAYCGVGQVAGIAIPIGLNDAEREFAAYCIDVYSAEAKNYLTPAYMGANLNRDVPDDSSWEMIEIIFDSLVYDIGNVYSFASLNKAFATLTVDKSTDIASWLDSHKSAVSTAIDDLVDAYRLG